MFLLHQLKELTSNYQKIIKSLKSDTSNKSYGHLKIQDPQYTLHLSMYIVGTVHCVLYYES